MAISRQLTERPDGSVLVATIYTYDPRRLTCSPSTQGYPVQ